MTVFPLWHDMRTDIGLSGCSGFPTGNCGVFTSVSGVAPNRIFNIEWRTVRFADNTARENFEARLYETSSTKQFDVLYGATNGITGCDTGGVQGHTGFFTQDFCNAAPPSSGSSRTYQAPGCFTPTPTITGTRTVTPTPTPTACQTSWQTRGEHAHGSLWRGRRFRRDLQLCGRRLLLLHGPHPERLQPLRPRGQHVGSDGAHARCGHHGVRGVLPDG